MARARDDRQTHRGGLIANAIWHYQAGQFREAGQLVRQLLARDPNDIAALHLTGLLALQAGLNEAAVDVLQRAVTLNSQLSDLHGGLAEALQRVGRFDEAITHFRRAVALDPDDVETLYNCGNVLLRLQRHDEALADYDRALAVKPDFAEALHNRGNALVGMRRYEEAVADYDRALAISPDFALALRNRANALLRLGRHTDAMTDYDRALAIRPDFVEVLNDRGNALSELGRYEEAARSFEQLVAVAPGYDYAQGALLGAKLYCCDWRDYGLITGEIVAGVTAGRRVAVPYLSLFVSGSPALQLRCAQVYSGEGQAGQARAVWQDEIYRHEKIRIAYLSADFHRHATAYLMAGLFEAHDKACFETTALSFGPDTGDEMQARVKNAVGRFVDVRSCSDAGTARLLKDMEIDIAIDLKGYSQFSRPGILALRPAPIQVNFLGYPGTMGVGHIDYILADRFVIPQAHQEFYQEKVAYLPFSYQPNDVKRQIAERTPSRAQAGLPETGLVFCCFNQHYKIAPVVFDVWMRLLGQVDGSVLWLLEGDTGAMRNLRREAERRGIAPERLTFAARVRQEDHLARHRLADLLLDTMPYNAHTAASDALWAGLPVVTLLGSSFAGRVGASLLNAVGLPELVAGSLEDYEALALKLARDNGLLMSIKRKLQRNRRDFPLFDTNQFCRDLESALRTMWARHQSGEPPAPFAVGS